MLGQRAAKQEFDLRIGTAELVGCPAGEGVVHRWVQPKQKFLTFGSHGSLVQRSGIHDGLCVAVATQHDE
jgi:hypothetical protein